MTAMNIPRVLLRRSLPSAARLAAPLLALILGASSLTASAELPPRDESGLTDEELRAWVERIETDPETALPRIAAEGPAVAPRVRELLRSPTGESPSVRGTAYGMVLDRLIRDALARAEEEEGSVRYRGQFSSLAPLGADGATILLDLFASEDELLRVRRQAATALGDLGGEAELPALRRLADDFLTELWVQEEASYLLARFGDRTWVDRSIAEWRAIIAEVPTAATLPAILTAHGDLGHLRYRLGEYASAVEHYRAKERLLQQLKETVREELRSSIQAEIDLLQYNLACSLALGGELDAAFAALERSVASRDITLDMIRVDGDLRSLRADPRYEEWFRRLAAERTPAGDGRPESP